MTTTFVGYPKASNLSYVSVKREGPIPTVIVSMPVVGTVCMKLEMVDW